jgi:phosphoribosyl-AMP cyclohydrolase
MTLYYISETGSLDSGTIAAYIETDGITEETKEMFSYFRKEIWQKNIKRCKASYYSRFRLNLLFWAKKS